MEYRTNLEESFEDKFNDPKYRLLYLRQQQSIVERIRQLKELFEQIVQFQRQVIALNHENWSKMDSSVESLQADVDWYVKEYIRPIQEKKQELDKLENSLINIPEKQGVVGKIGKFFERFIPGITKEGRQRRSVADRKQILEDEIDTFELVMEKSPFQIFGANKDAKSKLLSKMDVTELGKYSMVQNDFKSHLSSNDSVKEIANSIKREDMNRLLESYPILKGKSSNLINELINNGIESFNSMVSQIAIDSNQEKGKLMNLVDFTVQEDSNIDILSDITQQIQSIMNNLTPEELEELNQREQEADMEK